MEFLTFPTDQITCDDQIKSEKAVPIFLLERSSEKFRRVKLQAYSLE